MISQYAPLDRLQEKVLNLESHHSFNMSIPVFGMSDAEYRNALKEIKTAILPIGSLEQHGAHLPVSTDSLIAEHIAKLVADRLGAFVLPVMSYGVSFEHRPMFNVSLKNSTLSGIITDTCISLADNGVKRIILLNGHHGNVGALQYTSQELNGKVPKNVRVYTVHYWHLLDHEFDHAGEVETSLVLAIAPGLVRMDMAAPNSKRLSKSKHAYSTMTNAPGSFPKLTGNGVWGDPRKASAAKGNQWLERIVANLLTTMSELGK